MYIAVRQTCCLITKNRSIARSLIIPKKWSIARSLITEIEVINRSLNSITFRSQHFENFRLFLYYCPSKLECLKNPGNCSELFFRCFCGTNGPTAAAFLVKLKKKLAFQSWDPIIKFFLLWNQASSAKDMFACNRRWPMHYYIPYPYKKKIYM